MVEVDHRGAADPGISSGTSVRFDYLDNIKWTLAVLVILHHSAAVAGLDPFPINLPHVHPSERYQYGILRTFQSINQGFFMSLFFFISAYFVRPSYAKKGPWLFMKGKLKRLGIPTVLTILLIDPVALSIASDGAFWDAMRLVVPSYADMLQSWNMIMGVTWFCWALIVFNAVYVLVRAVAPSGKVAPALPAPFPGFFKILLFATAMVPVNFLALHAMNVVGEDFLGFHLLKYFPMYVAMFCFGLLAQKNQWLDELNLKHAFTWIVVWIMARVFLNPLSLMVSRPFEVIGMSIFLLYSYKTLFNSTTYWSRRLSRVAYAAYVIQVVPLCLIGKMYEPHMTQYPLVNFVLIGISGVIITFSLAHFICKTPVLRRVF
ncbi:acyltransferase family protein [Pseudodesulfovibrio senegalensis]|uniref:acyltransferase family protein n=1 Tax=Pseudodesulfovibrio senegalensis TaxID=1721087 RepID=UPI0019D52BC4|nr:acyltransferase [Pseudodesulfovibrio senegalensis]